MKKIYLPPMALAALKTIDTSFPVLDDKILGVPVWARRWDVLVCIWFSSKILPVVGIDALSLLKLSIFFLLYRAGSS
jgi:hypothetical protein